MQLIKTLFRDGIHGIEHAYRVLMLVQKIAELEQLDKATREVLEFCAVFHDIGRTNDNIDDLHGAKSIIKLKRINFLNLKRFNNDLIKYIIENHCISDNKAHQNASNYNINDHQKAVYLLDLFKDADNLDRVRFNDLNTNFLRFENSYTLVSYAKSLCNSNFSLENIEKQFKKSYPLLGMMYQYVLFISFVKNQFVRSKLPL
ncbi:MAG: HD domain-containing protein [Bacteroidota bacterium]